MPASGALGVVEHVDAAGELDHARDGRGRVEVRAEQPPERRGVARGERVGDQVAHPRGDLAQDLFGDGRVPELDAPRCNPGRAERATRGADGLDVGRSLAPADALDAGLGDLPVAPGAAARAAHHATFVHQAQGHGRVAVARGRDAGDLRRHVRTQGHELARLGLDEAHQVGPRARREPPRHDLFALERGRHGELVAVALEVAEDRAGEGAPLGRARREQVAHPGRERERGGGDPEQSVGRRGGCAH